MFRLHHLLVKKYNLMIPGHGYWVGQLTILNMKKQDISHIYLISFTYKHTNSKAKHDALRRDSETTVLFLMLLFLAGEVNNLSKNFCR